MLYSEFMIKAKEEVIEQAENGLWYLDPDWQFNLTLAELTPDNVSDFTFDWNFVEDSLKLEVEKRNTENSLKPYIMNWVHDIITETMEPLMTDGENNLFANFMDFVNNNKKEQKSKENEDWNKFKNS